MYKNISLAQEFTDYLLQGKSSYMIDKMLNKPLSSDILFIFQHLIYYIPKHQQLQDYALK